eukprot:g20713.t1
MRSAETKALAQMACALGVVHERLFPARPTFEHLKTKVLADCDLQEEALVHLEWRQRLGHGFKRSRQVCHVKMIRPQKLLPHTPDNEQRLLC